VPSAGVRRVAGPLARLVAGPLAAFDVGALAVAGLVAFAGAGFLSGSVAAAHAGQNFLAKAAFCGSAMSLSNSFCPMARTSRSVVTHIRKRRWPWMTSATISVRALPGAGAEAGCDSTVG
jgi:hypothetical protein